MDELKRIKKAYFEIVNENMYLSLATTNTENEPWISSVFYYYDKDYNFYWCSPKESKHSQNIRQNGKIAVSIFNSTVLSDDMDSAYFTARVEEIADISKNLDIFLGYAKRLYKYKIITMKSLKAYIPTIIDFHNESPLRFYKATPIEMWKLGSAVFYKGHEVDRRVKVEI